MTQGSLSAHSSSSVAQARAAASCSPSSHCIHLLTAHTYDVVKVGWPYIATQAVLLRMWNGDSLWHCILGTSWIYRLSCSIVHPFQVTSWSCLLLCALSPALLVPCHPCLAFFLVAVESTRHWTASIILHVPDFTVWQPRHVCRVGLIHTCPIRVNWLLR